MISQKIKIDVIDEFSKLKKSLQTHLNGDFNVSERKKSLQTKVSEEIASNSKRLLETLVNYLMEDARERIKTADVKLQNAFYDADFRKRVDEWARQLENKLALEPNIVKYTFDPRLKQGLIAAGVTFVAGASVTKIFVPSVVGAILAGIVTLLLSALVFKIAYDKASPKARETIEMDIEQYLASAQKQVSQWLEKVVAAFNNDFHAFCSANGFELEGEAK